MKKLVALFKKLTPDSSDFLLFSGLSMLFYGIYQINKPSAFMVTGILIMCVALLPLLRNKN